MLRNKKYEIDAVKFQLRDPNDFDMDEGDYVQEFFRNFYTPDQSSISGNITSDDLVKLFEIILVPCNGKLPDNFSYRKAIKRVSSQIIADFFLNSVFSTMNIVKSLKSSMKEQLKQ